MFLFFSCQIQPQEKLQSDTLLEDSGESNIDIENRFERVASEPSVVRNSYLSSQWSLNPDLSDGYTSPFAGESPTFYVLHPEVMPEEASVMWWFHGSAFGLDIEETPVGCLPDKIIPAAKRVAFSENLPATLLSHNNWILIAPRNDWCDMWRGIGNDDPGDPENHFGGHHLEEVMNFIRAGGLDFTPTKEALWGTSMGGVAAMLAQGKHGPFSSIVMDSSPSSALLFYELDFGPNDQAALEHVFGGPPYNSAGQPSDFHSSYTQTTAEYLVESGDLDIPLFLAFNSQDKVTPNAHPLALAEAISSFGHPSSGFHDFSHPSPGADNHVQTLSGPNLEQGYFASAMFQFSNGFQVVWLEAETECPSCTISTPVSAMEYPELKVLSGAAGRTVNSEDSGIFWAQPIESHIDFIQPMLSSIQSDQNIHIVFFEDSNVISTHELSPNLFSETGLEAVLEVLKQSMIAVPTNTTFIQINLSAHSSAILDGMLLYSDASQ